MRDYQHQWGMSQRLPLTCVVCLLSISFIFRWCYFWLNNLEPFLCAWSQLLMPFLSSFWYGILESTCLFYLHVFFKLYVLKGLSDVFLHFIHFQIVIFAFHICIWAFSFAHTLPTPSPNISIIIFVVTVKFIMTSKSVVSMYWKMWAPDMMNYIV